MNNLSRQRLRDLNDCYRELAAIEVLLTPDQWTALSQQELFAIAVRGLGKRANPSVLQTAIEQLERFQLPRNVQEQDHVNV